MPTLSRLWPSSLKTDQVVASGSAARCSGVKASPGITNGSTACTERWACIYAGRLRSAYPSVSESRCTSQAFPTVCGRRTSCSIRCGTGDVFAHSTSSTTSTVRQCTFRWTLALLQVGLSECLSSFVPNVVYRRYCVPTTVLSSSEKHSRVGRRTQVWSSNTSNRENRIRMHTSSASTEPTVKNCSTSICSHHLMTFEKPPGGGCASTTKNDPMTHWTIARPARFINPPETLLWHCRLDGEAYGITVL